MLWRSGGSRISSDKRQGEAILMLAAIVWGISMPLMKSLLEQMNVAQILFIRFGVAIILLAPIAWYKRDQYRQSWFVPGMICGLAMAVTMLLALFSLLYTSATRSAFILSLFVVLVPITGRMFLGVVISRHVIWGVGFALLGSYCLTSMDSAQNLGLNWGDFLAFLSALAASFHIHCIDRFARQMPSFWLNFQQSAYVSLIVTVWCLLDEGISLTLTAQGWVEVMILALFCTVFTFWASVWGQARTGANRAVMFFAVEPVAASIFASLLLGETLGVWGFWGSGLILCGVLIVASQPQPQVQAQLTTVD